MRIVRRYQSTRPGFIRGWERGDGDPHTDMVIRFASTGTEETSIKQLFKLLKNHRLRGHHVHEEPLPGDVATVSWTI